MSRVLEGRGVLTAEWLRALESGREIVRQAEESAERIREDARQQGREEGRAEIAATLVEARMIRARSVDAARGDLVRLSTEIARRLWSEARDLDPQHVIETCESAIDALHGARRLVVRAHPEDEVLLAGLAGREDVPLRIEPDPGLERGECIVESDAATVDARIRTRIDALARAMDEVLARDGGEP